jgi:peptidoglycan/LPS O-acetylase OafA/YrhL
MKVEIRALTGLRGAAATAVMIDHYMAVDFTRPFPWPLLPHGYVAVDLFMILSGFVLAMSYEARFATMATPAFTTLFLKTRIARLYPIYALMTLACFVLCRLGWLTFLSPDASWSALAANLLAIQTWIWPGNSLDGPGWSLSAEWAANLLFPALMPVMLARSSRSAAVFAAASVVALLVSAVLFGTLFDVPARGAVNIISGPEALGRCVSEFIIGMYLWRVKSRARWPRVFSGDAVQAGLVAAMVLLLLDPALDVAFVLLSGLLILGLSFDRSALSRLLASGPAHALGVISYSIYIIHIALLPLRDVLARRFDAASVPHSWISAVACTAAVAIGLAVLGHYLVEVPAQRWLLRLSRRPLRTPPLSP